MASSDPADRILEALEEAEYQFGSGHIYEYDNFRGIRPSLKNIAKAIKLFPSAISEC